MSKTTITSIVIAEAQKEAFERVLTEVVRARMNSTPTAHIISWLQAHIKELEEVKDGHSEAEH